jgi:hypothetical protein
MKLAILTFFSDNYVFFTSGFLVLEDLPLVVLASSVALKSVRSRSMNSAYEVALLHTASISAPV